MRSIPLGRWCFSVSLVAATTGCAAVPRDAAAPPASVPSAPPESGASAPGEVDLIVQEAVNARVTVALHFDRLAPFRFGRHLAQLGGLDAILESTGIDPLRDVQRAFLAARTSHLGRGAIVLHHTADERSVTRALAKLHRAFRAAHPPATARAARGGGRDDTAVFQRRLTGLEDRIARIFAVFPDPSRYPFPAAYHLVRERVARTVDPVLIAAPHPGLLVVLPPERVLAVFRLMEVAAPPIPASDEAVVFRAWDPESSLGIGPLWSHEVRYAEGVLALDPSGVGTLRFRAVCASPEAARSQAARMTDRIERAQTLSIAGTKLRLFDPIEFRAEEDRVEMVTRLLARDVDWLVAMAMKSP